MTVTAMQDGKIVLKKEDRKYYTAEKDPEILEFGEASYITLEGKGEPGGELFQSHINVLFTLAYQLKNAYKAMGHDFSMSSLEALWWAKSGKITEEAPPEEWTTAAECTVGSLAGSLIQAERDLILDALKNGQGNRREAAERLGISPRTLRYKLARLREAGVEVPHA